MKPVWFANLEVNINDQGDVSVVTPGGDVVGNTTVADALISVDALHALLRYAAIEDGD